MNFLSGTRARLVTTSLRSGCYFKMDKKSQPELELNDLPRPRDLNARSEGQVRGARVKLLKSE